MCIASWPCHQLPGTWASLQVFRGCTINAAVSPSHLLDEAFGSWEGGILLAKGCDQAVDVPKDLGLEKSGLQCKTHVVSQPRWQGVRENGRCQGGLPILLLRCELETRRAISFQYIYCAVWWAPVPVPPPTLFQKPTALKRCCAFGLIECRIQQEWSGASLGWGVLGDVLSSPHTTPNPNSLC